MTMSAAAPGRFGAAFDCLGVERAWQRTRGSADVLIAIVEQNPRADVALLGTNIPRPAATPGASAEPCGEAGLHAAAVAVGRHDETRSCSGVAPASRILPVRFATHPGAQALNLAQAIEYAVEKGACIVNLASAADLAEPAARRAIQYAAARNALVVCTAGEGVVAAEEICAPNVIRVMAVDERHQPLTAVGEGAAHLAAPGYARIPREHGGHDTQQSESIAAPYVSGCAALVKALNPGWGYHEIKEHLLASGSAQPQLASPCAGHMLDVANAVLGPIELVGEARALTWSALADGSLEWRLRYRSALCVNLVALYRPHGDEHWRELAYARAGALRMTVPACALRRSRGTLRLASRESNFHADDLELTIL